MSLHGVLEYKKSKIRAKELKHVLIKLDMVADILYDNLEHGGVWSLIQHLEEVRICYFIEYTAHNGVVKNKGKINE